MSTTPRTWCALRTGVQGKVGDDGALCGQGVEYSRGEVPTHGEHLDGPGHLRVDGVVIGIAESRGHIWRWDESAVVRGRLYDINVSVELGKPERRVIPRADNRAADLGLVDLKSSADRRRAPWARGYSSKEAVDPAHLTIERIRSSTT